jgi:hypothetical protein
MRRLSRRLFACFQELLDALIQHDPSARERLTELEDIFINMDDLLNFSRETQAHAQLVQMMRNQIQEYREATALLSSTIDASRLSLEGFPASTGV